MKNNFQKRKPIWKQIVSLFLVITMVLSMAPVSAFDVQAADDQVTVKLYFENTYSWENVYLYSWVTVEGSDTYPTGGWPGTQIASTDSDGYYIANVKTSASKAFNFIFNNGSGTQTGNLSISASTLANDEDGVVEAWVDARGNVSDGTLVESPEVNGTSVTFRYRNSSVSNVYVAGNMNSWSITANPMTKDDNGVWTLTMELTAGTYEYKFVIPGGNDDGTDLWITDPRNDQYANGNSVVTLYESPVVSEGSVTFKYANDSATSVEVFGSMNSWASGYAMTKDSDGLWSCALTGLETGEIQYKFVVDGSTWIADPANKKTAGSDGNSVAYIPGILDASVAGKKGTTIALPTSISYLEADGTTSKKTVASYSTTEDVTVSDTSVTVPEAYEGTKFDLTATTTDGLTATVTVGLYVNNEITVKIHYSREDGVYTDWNVWAWTDSGSDAYDFAVEGNEQVATVVTEDGLNANALNFIVREGEWDSQEGGGRSVDLSNVVSGTVHCYVVAGKTAQSDLTFDYSEAIQGTKLNSIVYDRDTNTVVVTASQDVIDAGTAFAVTHLDGTAIEVNSVSESGSVYTLEIGENLTGLQAVCKTYKLIYDGNSYIITMPNVYSTEEFETEYTYDGDDLGSIWSEESTTFKVWAPTADSVSVYLYEDGTVMEDDADYVDAANPGNTEDDKPYQIVAMTKGDKGVWSATVTGDLNGKYYTYVTYVNGETEESCDPYARTTGANGERAMVIDLDSTDPEGWDEDDGPDNGMDYTDAVIYELHVRDFSIDDSSGVSEEYQGKFLAFKEEGTTVNGEGEISTGLDYLVNLGVTHIHLLPSYDYASIDETMTEEEKAENLDKQFNWGYDPENYNVPEGSYSTDPHNGEVRVNEMKQMVQSLHDNNINVIMDVVYNHVYDAATFCINEIVPGYFSRPDSNTSGCGNDTASERNMVRKYIVDSVVYWAKEYHIDGFRFDLVGLLDTETINQIVKEVHAIDPDIIFYGEGWDMDSTNTTKSVSMARQGNAYLTPEFAYFSDSMRDLVRGGNNDEAALGFATGLTGKEENMAYNFMANIWWTSTPTQVVQYASCHDNYTLMDKINVSRSNASEADRIKMNNLTAAIYLTAEGIPLIHAGEEMLRTKVNSEGTVIHNSYKSPDYINSIKWDNLESEAVQDVSEYYQGLIEFRKNHAGLRLTTSTEVSNYVSYTWLTNEVIMMQISGDATDEVSDGIVIIFNATSSNKSFNLYEKGVATGEWQVCINSEQAGIDVIETISDGNVTVDALSALVLVKGETKDTGSVYVQNTKATYNVTVTSAIEGTEGTVATVSGGGKYVGGKTATVTAPAMEGYTFLGWYAKTETGYADTAESTTLTYSFKVTADKDLVAVYKANGKATLEVTGDTFTVNKGATQSSQYMNDITLGTTVTVSYTGANEFYYWQNENGKIVSTDKEYTFVFTGKTTLTAIYKGSAEVTVRVEFISAYNQVIAAASYNQNDIIDFPTGPSKLGGTFKGWSVNGVSVTDSASVWSQLKEGETRIVLTPEYEMSTTEYQVTVKAVTTDGADLSNDSTYSFTAGTTTRIDAPVIEGKQFAYWTNAAGEEAISYSEYYSLTVTDESITLYAVYVEEGTTITKEPVIEVTDKYASIVDETNKVSFVVTRDVPEGYTLQEHGVIYTIDDTYANSKDVFVIDANNVTKYASSENASYGTFVFNIKVGDNVTTTIYLRGYMKVVNEATGNTEVVYSDISSASYSNLSSTKE